MFHTFSANSAKLGFGVVKCLCGLCFNPNTRAECQYMRRFDVNSSQFPFFNRFPLQTCKAFNFVFRKTSKNCRKSLFSSNWRLLKQNSWTFFIAACWQKYCLVWAANLDQINYHFCGKASLKRQNQTIIMNILRGILWATTPRFV